MKAKPRGGAELFRKLGAKEQTSKSKATFCVVPMRLPPSEAEASFHHAFRVA